MPDDLYAQPDLYDTLLPVDAACRDYYLALAQQHPGAVLELACGTGQLAVPIAVAGQHVVGVDSSPAMLRAAAERAAGAGVSLELLTGDMRDFDLNRTFSLVFLARNSMLHLHTNDDLVAAFSAVRRHLALDGVFAFDIFNPDMALLARALGQRYPVMRMPSERLGELTVEASFDYDAATQVNHSRWHVSASGRPDAWTLPIVVRSIFPQELLFLIDRAGFRLLSRHGDYAGETFTGASARQVCLCRPA